MDGMSDVLTEVRFLAIVGEISKRTICCSPELESRVKGYIDARGLSGLFTVIVSPALPNDRILVVDDDALQAEMNRPLKWNFGGTE